MNSAQRAAFNEMVKYGDVMAMLCDQLADTTIAPRSIHDLRKRWDAARNRYFELEHEAKQSRTAQQMARKGLGRKSTAGR